MAITLFLLIVALAGSNQAYVKHQHRSEKNPLLVSTPLGDVLGAPLTTRLGKTIYAFRGMRYAQPPIGDLRFKPPVAVEKWEGTYNATADGFVCPQPGIEPVSEDCLFLNVYTTELPEGSANPRRPVIVHLHAGGFYSVTGRSDWAGPQYFLDQNIVLVTLNYRLATLGFLAVGKEVPGNNGLKDQVMALKWVKRNIESFGGDPNSVTLYGYSAGAWSINLHLVSPMSRGLFHKVIASSGSALGIWPLPKHQIDLAKKQAKFLGCSDASLKEVMECLRTKPARAMGESFFQFHEFGFNPVLIWSPVIEEDFGQERFLPDDPYKMIKRGDFIKVPYISGVTTDEFANMAFPLVANATLLNQLNDNFEKLAPISFIYEKDTPKSREVSREARRFYLGNSSLTNYLPGLTKLYADAVVGFPVNRAIKLISEKNTQPTYYYKFSYQGRYSHFYLPDSNGTAPYGVVHHDDLIYAFYISKIFPYFQSSDPEVVMVEKLTSFWANFAKTGNPTPQTIQALDSVKWEPFNLATQKYLDIGNKLVTKDRMFERRYNFWEKLYPVFEPL